MDDKKELFENLPVRKAMFKFVMPTVLSQLVTIIYNLGDTFFVGHTGDSDQLSALTLSFPIFMMLTALANLFGIGANSMISRSLGISNEKQAKAVSTFSFYGGISVTAFFILLLVIFMNPVLIAMGASSNTYEFTKDYITWVVVIGGIPSVAGMLLAHMLRADGNSKQASIGMSMGGVINIILDFIFVPLMGKGITGAAIATALSNVAVCIYFFILIYKKRDTTVICLNLKKFRLPAKIMSEVIFVGFPASLLIILGSTANIVLTHYMSDYGDINVAAFGVVQKVGSIAIQITVGVTQGIMPLLGYNFATGNEKRVRAVNNNTIVLLSAYTVVCVAAAELFPEKIMALFTSDNQTIAYGAVFMKKWFFCVPGMCYTCLFNSIFQAIGKWKQSMALSLLRQAVFLIPMLIILNNTIGMYGLVWAQPISDTVALIAGIGIYGYMSRHGQLKCDVSCV